MRHKFTATKELAALHGLCWNPEHGPAELPTVMAGSWVIRLAQADKTETPLLIKVTPKEGGHDIDLDLLATDGEAAFTGKGEMKRDVPATTLLLTDMSHS